MYLRCRALSLERRMRNVRLDYIELTKCKGTPRATAQSFISVFINFIAFLRVINIIIDAS